MLTRASFAHATGYALRGLETPELEGHVNVIGTLVEQGTLSLFDANINADISSQWLKQDLIPKASVIVMDNAHL